MKDIAFVIFYAIDIQKTYVFFFKRNLFMVLLLIFDVVQCFTYYRLADGICGISSLPFKMAVSQWIQCLYPTAAVSFNSLCHCRYCCVPGEEE